MGFESSILRKNHTLRERAGHPQPQSSYNSDTIVLIPWFATGLNSSLETTIVLTALHIEASMFDLKPWHRAQPGRGQSITAI